MTIEEDTVGHIFVPRQEMSFTFNFFFFYDFENSNIAECKFTDRFFVFVGKTPKMPREMRPPFSHRPKNESRQNQKQNLSNERSYQKIKNTQKHPCQKASSSGVIYV